MDKINELIEEAIEEGIFEVCWHYFDDEGIDQGIDYSKITKVKEILRKIREIIHLSKKN